MESRPVRIGIIGAGFVGSALAELLSDSSRAQALADAATAPVELVGVAVRDASRTRPGVPSDLVTDDFDELLSRDLLCIPKQQHLDSL